MERYRYTVQPSDRCDKGLFKVTVEQYVLQGEGDIEVWTDVSVGYQDNQKYAHDLGAQIISTFRNFQPETVEA